MAKKETLIILRIVITLLTLLLSESANSAGKEPCAEDIVKFCKDIRPGGGRIMRCLGTNEKDPGPQCRE